MSKTITEMELGSSVEGYLKDTGNGRKRKAYDVSIEFVETQSMETRLEGFASLAGEMVLKMVSLLKSSLSDEGKFYKDYLFLKKLENLWHRYRLAITELNHIQLRISAIDCDSNSHLPETSDGIELGKE